ncbi:MAG: hypothetical protein IPL89_15900 [Acidobacteria bacterium]|nr:hypothetical protein [Acidobacteriota bacterium]MBK9963799.1 hypothetical protein [Holophagales bacterium]
MGMNLSTAATFVLIASSAGPLLASGDPSQAAGYACLASPKLGPVKVVLTPPPAGFKCPPGQKLFVVTRQMQEKASAPFAEVVEVAEPEPTPPPGLIAPPKKKPVKKTQPKNPIPPGGKVCTPDGTGGQYCCYSLHDCRLE